MARRTNTYWVLLKFALLVVVIRVITFALELSSNSSRTAASEMEGLKQDKQEMRQDKEERHQLTKSRMQISSDMIHFLKENAIEVLRSHLDGYKLVTLLDIPAHSKKGDSAITLGELRILSALNINIVHYGKQELYGKTVPNAKLVNATFLRAQLDNVSTSLGISGQLNETNMAVLGHGGGNLGTWPINDHFRHPWPELHLFAKYKYVLLAQSMSAPNQQHLEFMKQLYGDRSNLTFLLRDYVSYERCQQHFPRVHSVLSPDMAFGIGLVRPFFDPILDVIWINRVDYEKVQNHKPKFPGGVNYLVTDWTKFETPKGQNVIDGAYLAAFNGFLFLQRGRVVVTDRLHACIMAVLLNLPTVVMDNKIHKLANFLNTWPEVLDSVMVASSTEDAVDKAMYLLDKIRAGKAPH